MNTTTSTSRITDHGSRSPNGKIARLPRDLREQLNHRLENGETDHAILPWLNSLPAVKTVLADQFASSPINKQNLANWRGGGHQRWRQQQERRDLVRDLAQNAGELAAEANGLEPAGHLSTIIVAELALAAQEAQATLTDPAERCQRLQELLLTLAKVRQQDFLAGRLAIERERRARERMTEADEDNYRQELAVDPVVQRLKLLEFGKLSSTPTMEAQRLALQKAEALLRSAKNPPPHPRSQAARVAPSTSSTSSVSSTSSTPSTSQAQSSLVKINLAKSAATACRPARKIKRRSPAHPVPRQPALPKPGEGQSAAAEVLQPKRRAGRRLSQVPVPDQTPMLEEKPASVPVDAISSTPPASQAQSSLVKVNAAESISPVTPPPQLEPAAEAYNRWFRMNRGVEPFNPDALEKLYAAIPPAAPKQNEGGPAAPECDEGGPNEP